MIILSPIGTQSYAIVNTKMSEPIPMTYSKDTRGALFVFTCWKSTYITLIYPCPPFNYPKLTQTFMSLLIIDFLIHMINYKAIKITLTFAVEFLCLSDLVAQFEFLPRGGVCCCSSCRLVRTSSRSPKLIKS